jgi:hypothetical protein
VAATLEQFILQYCSRALNRGSCHLNASGVSTEVWARLREMGAIPCYVGVNVIGKRGTQG